MHLQRQHQVVSKQRYRQTPDQNVEKGTVYILRRAWKASTCRSKRNDRNVKVHGTDAVKNQSSTKSQKTFLLSYLIAFNFHHISPISTTQTSITPSHITKFLFYSFQHFVSGQERTCISRWLWHARPWRRRRPHILLSGQLFTTISHHTQSTTDTHEHTLWSLHRE